jgi:ubiquinone/menaquinone biosynthesis C-methylase UbiE
MSDVEKFTRFYESDFGRRILEKEAGYVYKELKECNDILDIGCGTGNFEHELSDLNITGLDISEEMIEEARKISDKRFIVGNAEKLEFDDLSFDAVFYVATLEFVANYTKAIREAWRVTRPGGKLLVIMLNTQSRYFQEQSQDEDSYFRKVLHRNLEEIREYISKFYEITKSEYFLGIAGQEIFESSDKKYASLYSIAGRKLSEVV